MLDTPLTFIPILVPKVWGGQRLQNIGKQLPAGEPIGESWELADMPGKGPCSVVEAARLLVAPSATYWTPTNTTLWGQSH